jgi:hypothetical protein
MTSPNVEAPLPAEITIGEKYSPAMEIQTQEEADAYFEKCVVHAMRFGRLRAEAEQLERRNLGYYAGYYGEETRERVERLFKCAHPIFGKIAEHGAPSDEEAFDRGVRGGLGLGL